MLRSTPLTGAEGETCIQKWQKQSRKIIDWLQSIMIGEEKHGSETFFVERIRCMFLFFLAIFMSFGSNSIN